MVRSTAIRVRVMGQGRGAEAGDADGFVGEGNCTGPGEATRRWQLMVRQ